MRNFLLVMNKELKSYFYSPIAYVVITIFLAVTGYLFYNSMASFSTISFQAQADPMLAKQSNMLNITENVVRPLFGLISMVMLMMMPLLTMRLFAEEKKAGTLELLLTYPVTDAQVLLGKFFACLTVFAVMLLLSLTYPLFIAAYGRPEIGPIVTGYIGLFLMGAAFISLGIFASSMTENQIIAATVAFGALIFFWMISFSTAYVGPALGWILTYIAMTEHLESFAKGVLDSGDLIYYINFIALFLFMTLRVLESKKWRG